MKTVYNYFARISKHDNTVSSVIFLRELVCLEPEAIAE